MVKLSDHFTFRRLLRFAVPSIIMMIFTSIYSVVDGFFISNYVGETEFAAVNFIFPFLMIFDSVGFMLSTGGAAYVSLLLGQGKKEKANKSFSMLVYVAIAVGIMIGVLLETLMRPVAILLGAEGEMLEYAVLYGRVICVTAPAFTLQYTFQSFFVAAERPKLGLTFTVVAGVSNMILDWLFMAVFNWGVVGAAVASCIGQVIGGIGPLIYFASKNTSLLRICKTKYDAHTLKQTCSNGVAELVTNASMSLVNMVYNIQLLKFAGESGVAAYGIIMYLNFVFVSAFIGYTMGTAPIISFNYGAETYLELKNVSKKSRIIIYTGSVLAVAIAEVFAKPLAAIFAGYDPEFLELSIHALKLYSYCYLFTGINVFTSGFFAALNNGKISAFLSLLRMLVFQLLSVLIIPIFLKTDGIWISMLVAEAGTAIFTFSTLKKYSKEYHY